MIARMNTVMPDIPATHPATALDLLRSTLGRVKASASADSGDALRIIHEALALTATANRLIDKALMECESEVYWPGENFLTGARQQHLELAVNRLGAELPTPIHLHEHDQVTTLTPPEIAPPRYQPHQPDGYDGVVCDPDPAEKARQLLLHRTQTVASANKATWTHVRDLLARLIDHDDPNSKHHKACRITALLIDEILNPSSADHDDIHQRILAIEGARRSGADPTGK